MPYHHHYDVQCSLIFFKTVYVYVVHNEAYRSVFFCSSILHILIWHVKLLICLCVRITNQQLHTIITFIWQYVLIWDSLNLYSRNHSSENANDTTESTLSATIHDQQHRPKVIHERFLFGFCCCSPSHECIAYRHRITVVEWHFTLFRFACRNKQRSKKKKKCFFFVLPGHTIQFANCLLVDSIEYRRWCCRCMTANTHSTHTQQCSTDHSWLDLLKG